MNILDQIIVRKREEIDNLKEEMGSDPYHPLHGEIKRKNLQRFFNAFQKKGIIAEIKRKSPSKGDINLALDSAELAKEYKLGGASALSVLTDKVGFGGTIEDLIAVKIPIPQKGFIVDPLQIKQEIHAGADVVLLIVSVFKEQTGDFLRSAKEMGIDALVEVHNEEEIKIAIEAGAKIIGINNRDLKTFKVDLSLSIKLVQLLPKECIKIGESGVKSADDAYLLFNGGFDAIPIGETLVKSSDPKREIGEMNDAH